MNKMKTMFLTLMVLMAATLSAQDAITTQLNYLELEAVDSKSQTLVIAGKQYRYQLDVANSSYVFEDDAKKALKLTDLKEGESYYFELMAKGDEVKANSFGTIIFIAETQPSE